MSCVNSLSDHGSQFSALRNEKSRNTRTSQDMRAILLSEIELYPIAITLRQQHPNLKCGDLPVEIKGYRTGVDIGGKYILEFLICNCSGAVPVNNRQNSV